MFISSYSTTRVNTVLDVCGQNRSLKTLSLAEPSLSFLQANAQLSKVDLWPNQFSAKVIEVEILPLLPMFSNLTSLRIAWLEEYWPEIAPPCPRWDSKLSVRCAISTSLASGAAQCAHRIVLGSLIMTRCGTTCRPLSI